MEKTISLERFAPIIYNEEQSREIYNIIHNEDPINNVIYLDFKGIKAITLLCAIQIFKRLMTDLSYSRYQTNVLFKNENAYITEVIYAGLRFNEQEYKKLSKLIRQ